MIFIKLHVREIFCRRKFCVVIWLCWENIPVYLLMNDTRQRYYIEQTYWQTDIWLNWIVYIEYSEYIEYIEYWKASSCYHTVHLIAVTISIRMLRLQNKLYISVHTNRMQQNHHKTDDTYPSSTPHIPTFRCKNVNHTAKKNPIK